VTRTPEPNPQIAGGQPPALLVVISGPSGVGKDSVLLRMRERGVAFHFVVTATSRPIRLTEQDGRDYHFVSRERFEAMIGASELIEWAEVYGHYKGVPKFEIRDALASGRDVVLRLDVQGAATVRKLAPEAVLIFIAPSSPHELHARIAGRQTEGDAEMLVRLATAEHEMACIDQFDYIVINRTDQLDATVDQICAIVLAEKHRVFPRQPSLA
jgi:guanylate kinase